MKCKRQARIHVIHFLQSGANVKMLIPSSWLCFRFREPKAVITAIAIMKSTKSTQTINDCLPENFSYQRAMKMAATDPTDAQKLSQSP